MDQTNQINGFTRTESPEYWEEIFTQIWCQLNPLHQKNPSVLHLTMSVLSSSYKNREKRKATKKQKNTHNNEFCAPKRSGVSG